MKTLNFFILILLGLILLSPSHAQTTYEMFVRLSDASGVITGPISSVPGVSGGNFFQVGCAEHQVEAASASTPGGPVTGLATQNPYLITRAFDPASSPYLRQQLHTNNTYTVDLYFVSVNGATRNTIFQVRLQNATLNKFTTAADSNGLQETLAFLYDSIIWTDVATGTSRGWDVFNNRTI